MLKYKRFGGYTTEMHGGFPESNPVYRKINKIYGF